jgi:hypothetical protein
VDFNPLLFEIFSIASFDPKLELLSLNVSSNRLDSLDDASVMWLKDTETFTDLSGNPWKCECTALGEAWRKLRHKPTLNCVSPEDRRGRTWDLIEEHLCPHIISFVEISSIDKLNISSDTYVHGQNVLPRRADLSLRVTRSNSSHLHVQRLGTYQIKKERG